MKNHTFTSDSPDYTKDLGRKLASRLSQGDVIGLQGELGGGKTTFVQGLSEGLHLKEGFHVSSPTFTLVNEYPCKEGMLFHMDFYRLANPLEAQTLGLDQYFRGQGICVVEWFEKAQSALPKDFLEIQFLWVSENNRNIHMLAHGPKSQKILSSFF